jgi:hypothetical protein
MNPERFNELVYAAWRLAVLLADADTWACLQWMDL